jgi:hypothetical protein
MEGTMPLWCIQVAHIYGNFSQETRQTISAMVSAVLQGHCACRCLGAMLSDVVGFVATHQVHARLGTKGCCEATTRQG